MQQPIQEKLRGVSLIALIAVAAIFVALTGMYVDAKREKGQMGDGTQNLTSSAAPSPTPATTTLKYPVYPATSDAPVLRLYWGEAKTATINPATLIEVEKFGVFEDMLLPGCETKKDPGTEWAIHFKPGSQPVYAYAPGTITNIQDEGVSKELVVRYGTSYAVKYLHVTRVPTALKVGDTIEAGTLVGYTQLLREGTGYEFWELELNKVVGGTIARTDFPLTYFDAESQAVFESLREASGLRSWFVDEQSKTAGWLAYVGKPEAWADMSKLGTGLNGDDYCQFLRDSGLF